MNLAEMLNSKGISPMLGNKLAYRLGLPDGSLYHNNNITIKIIPDGIFRGALIVERGKETVEWEWVNTKWRLCE